MVVKQGKIEFRIALGKGANGMKKRNQGSAIVEVTMIMPFLLLVMILLLSLLLGVLKQAEVHTDLMWYSISEKLQNGKCTEVAISAQGDKIIYSQQAELTLVKGYEIVSREQQVIRVSKVEDNLRRWQLIGYIASEGRVPSIFNIQDWL